MSDFREAPVIPGIDSVIVAPEILSGADCDIYDILDRTGTRGEAAVISMDDTIATGEEAAERIRLARPLIDALYADAVRIVTEGEDAAEYRWIVRDDDVYIASMSNREAMRLIGADTVDEMLDTIAGVTRIYGYAGRYDESSLRSIICVASGSMREDGNVSILFSYGIFMARQEYGKPEAD